MMRPATDGADTDPREYKTSIPAVCQGRFVQIRLPIADFRDWWHATRDRDVVRTVWLFWIALSGVVKKRLKQEAGHTVLRDPTSGGCRSASQHCYICRSSIAHRDSTLGRRRWSLDELGRHLASHHGHLSLSMYYRSVLGNMPQNQMD